MENLQELQTKVETKIKTLHLVARENQRIIKRDKEKEIQQHLELFEKKIEEILEMKYKVQEMIIDRNAKEEAIDKWTAKHDEKLVKKEQPKADIEEAVKNWKRIKSIEEKKEEKQIFERRTREEKQIEEMRQEL